MSRTRFRWARVALLLAACAALLPGLAVAAPLLVGYDRLPPRGASAAGSCHFQLGFAALHAALPTEVGDCLDDETYAANGDSLQRTTGGLLVWRKADNWTAFTDGARAWVNGPYGLEARLNDQRFIWEYDRGGQLVAPIEQGLIRQYYALINQRDYAQAYALWQNPPQLYDRFVAGYADTLHADVQLGPPHEDNAMDYYGVWFPTVLIARHTDGGQVAYVGCYSVAAHRSSLPGEPGAPGEPFRIFGASLRAAPDIHSFGDPAAQQALLSSCP